LKDVDSLDEKDQSAVQQERDATVAGLEELLGLAEEMFDLL